MKREKFGLNSIISTVCAVLFFSAGFSQTFSNTQAEVQGSWDQNLQKTISVSGLGPLQTNVLVLRQVQLVMGNPADQPVSWEHYSFRLVSPLGGMIELLANLNDVNPGFPTGTAPYMSLSLREHPNLRTPAAHGYAAQPFSIGYYRTHDVFSNFNGINPNGDWQLIITENHSDRGARFQSVTLEFGAPYTTFDATALNTNDNCATPMCLGPQQVLVGQLNGYTTAATDPTQAQAGNCAFGSSLSHSAWYQFYAQGTTAQIRLSGVTGLYRMVAFKSNANTACDASQLQLLSGGCPTAPFNDAYINPLYADGSAYNQQLLLNGLIPNQKYFVLIDSQGSTSPFYLDITGAAQRCSDCSFTGTAQANSPVCVGQNLLLSAGPGQNYLWTGPDGFNSTAQQPSIAQASLAHQGAYTVRYRNASGCETVQTVQVSVRSTDPPSFIQYSPFCQGMTPPALPTTSLNGISGTWSPATISNTLSGNYTFTPDPVLFPCSPQVTMHLVVLNNCTFGNYAAGVWFDNCTTAASQPLTNGNNFYNVTGIGANRIADADTNFQFVDADLGVYRHLSGQLLFRGGEIKTFKRPNSNVCGARLHYRIYALGSTPGAFTTLNLPFFNDCDTGSSQFPSGGPCQAGDQKWQKVLSNAEGPIDLTQNAPGQYVMELYYDVNGSHSSNSGCSDVIYLNDNGFNYKAYFTIMQNLDAQWTSPTACNTPDGTITLTGMAPNRSYSLTYTHNNNVVGPITVFANNQGEVSLAGLASGIYANFNILSNDCNGGYPGPIMLSQPTYTPHFDAVPAICAGQTLAPLPLTSIEGFVGSWTPATDNSQTTTYTFLPTPGQCVASQTLTIQVRNIVTPQFAAVAPICTGGNLSPLPTTSLNAITGSWSPALDNTQTTTYTFTPQVGQCALSQTLEITVNSIYNPTFTAIPPQCYGTSINPLPNTSLEGLQGSWTPAFNPTQTETYTFTAMGVPCANTASVQVHIDPIQTPVFAFGSAATYCQNDVVLQAQLPNTSQNNITGTWNPSQIDVSQPGIFTYVFTPDNSLCQYNIATYLITVQAQRTPLFDAIAPICSGAAIAPLSLTSTNGIAGQWSPALSNTQSDVYTFTPNPGQCATTQQLTIQILSPTPVSFLPVSACQGTLNNPLPSTSIEGVTGSWTPAFDPQNSQTYTFIPNAQCPTGNLQLQVQLQPLQPISFEALTEICAGDASPLPLSSQEGVLGSWSPAFDNQHTQTYTFTPATAGCYAGGPFTLSVQVTPKQTPTFVPMSICQGSGSPLPLQSLEGINGTWSPSFNNQQTASYTFTPQGCALAVVKTVVVNPLQQPNFPAFTPICYGGILPSFPTQSPNGVLGSWSPSPDNTQTLTYTFTPAISVCAQTQVLPLVVKPLPQLRTAQGCENFSYVLHANAQANTQFEWSTASQTLGQGAALTIQEPGTYTVAATLDGCTTSEALSVPPFYCEIPKGVSANNDAKNDVFDLSDFAVRQLQIYNRYGTEVYTKQNYSNEWDGHSNSGHELPTGTYYYLITFVDGSQKTGWVYLTR